MAYARCHTEFINLFVSFVDINFVRGNSIQRTAFAFIVVDNVTSDCTKQNTYTIARFTAFQMLVHN